MGMNNLKHLTIIFFIVFLGGCNGATDAEISINSNLKMHKTNPTTYSINYNSGQFLIEPVIEKVNWDQSYLIAKRNLPSHGSESDYWIIRLEDEEIYGPLSETNYLDMIKELNIDLELKAVKKIFN